MTQISSGIETVIITGAGRGIGRAMALRLGELGLHVVSIAKTKTADATRDAIIANGGSAESLQCDLANYVETKKQMETLASTFASRKIGLILAAAITGPTGPIQTSSLSEWDETLRVNILGNLAVYQAFFPYLLQQKFGRIILFSGGGGAFAFPAFPAYAASKTAIIRTAENMHADLKDLGDFAVVALSPGAVDTDMLRHVKAAGVEIKQETPIEKSVFFAEKFMFARTCQFSGRLVHANDDWQNYLDTMQTLEGESHWTLRRIEN